KPRSLGRRFSLGKSPTCRRHRPYGPKVPQHPLQERTPLQRREHARHARRLARLSSMQSRKDATPSEDKMNDQTKPAIGTAIALPSDPMQLMALARELALARLIPPHF